MRKKTDKFELIEMSEKAQGIFENIKEKMEAMGTYREEFTHVIELLANNIDHYNRCLQIVNSTGFSEATEKGGMKTLPEANMMVTLSSQINVISQQLKLTARTSDSGGKETKSKDPAKELIMKLGKVN